MALFKIRTRWWGQTDGKTASAPHLYRRSLKNNYSTPLF